MSHKIAVAIVHGVGKQKREFAKALAGTLKCTLKETLSPINAANLRKAHAKLESGTMIGKLVLRGW